ncbi:MAG: oxygen-dependent tRNA uridine(34) hydroxylase TrhO [Pararhizobium sp.]
MVNRPAIPPATPACGFLVAALYRFARLERCADLRAPLLALCNRLGVRGTLLLASEGINGTIAGTDEAIRAVLAHLRDQPELAGLEHKESRAAEMPFLRMKVRLKKEIVTMGVPDLDPENAAGTYVAPRDWNALIADPETIVVDTRNAYEVAIGSFRGAVDPGTRSFRDFPAWARSSPEMKKARKIAMFCTGGIRCEKATAFLKAEGFENVFHLKGGILRYLEEVPGEESLWEGACFVFDERVSMTHGLAEGGHALCRACRRPLAEADRLSPLCEEGVSCPHCHEERSEADRQRYRERQRQVARAGRRGERHLGG